MVDKKSIFSRFLKGSQQLVNPLVPQYQNIEAGFPNRDKIRKQDDGYEDVEVGIKKPKGKFLEEKDTNLGKFDPSKSSSKLFGSIPKNSSEHLLNLSLQHGKLSQEQAYAVREYSRHAYKNINASLYKGEQPSGITRSSSTTPPHDNAKIYHHLKAAIGEHTMPEDTVVFSGIKKAPSYISKQHEKTKTMMANVPAFLSTSHNHEIARDFADNGHVLRIHVPKGAHALHAGEHTVHPHEQETIFHPNSKLHIDPQRKTLDDPSRGPIHYYDAHLVHDGIKPTRHAKLYE